MTTAGLAFNRAAQLHPFLTAFKDMGGDPAPVLAAHGLDDFDLADPATLITGNALYGMINGMSDTLGDPYFAARVAERFVEAGPVFVRESFEAAHTLAEFLPLAILEIDRQINNIRYSLTINTDVTVVRGERRFTPTVTVAQADAAVASMWCTLLRITGGDAFDISRVTVTVQEREGIPPRILPRTSILTRKWNAVSIAFPSEWLHWQLAVDWRFPPIPRGEFSATSHRDAIVAFFAKICRDRLGDKSFDAEALALQVGAHPRTVQRALRELGTSIAEIRDGARRERALELIASPVPVSNEDMAEMLGFSSAPSFSRAFKRWTGKSPSEFRKRL